jgi:hypothetical protein
MAFFIKTEESDLAAEKLSAVINQRALIARLTHQ